MDELRKDYFLDRYVIISPARSERPHIVKHEKKKKDKDCAFCRGNEKKTGKELYRSPKKGEWQVRSFLNKYPAVTPRKNPEMKKDGFLMSSGSFGFHEVIVDAPEHDEELWDLSEKRLYDVISAYIDRIRANQDKEKVIYVAFFKNHGGLAGASIHHSHSQLISYSQIPQSVKDKEKAIVLLKNAYEQLIKSEMLSPRKCFENEHFSAFCPYASRFPYEITVFPKRHILNPIELGKEELESLAHIMRKILLKLKKLGNNYNFFFLNGIREMRFHIEFMQRTSAPGGFELGTDCFINTMSPEDAAKFYRQ